MMDKKTYNYFRGERNKSNEGEGKPGLSGWLIRDSAWLCSNPDR